MKFKFSAVILTLVLFWGSFLSMPVFSQTTENIASQTITLDNNATSDSQMDSGTKKYVAYGIVAGTIGGITLYGYTNWEWGSTTSWGWADEGWFGEDTYSGGSDKLGHLYTHYAIQRGFNNAFEWSLGDKRQALILSTGTASMVGLLIEIGDGTSDEYGFAWEDLAADFLGVGIGALLEYFPVADEFVGLSFNYSRENTYGDKKLSNVLNNYSGQKIMMNFRLAGFKAAGFDIPEFMRYIQFDMGYYTRGYTGFDEPGTDPSRHLFVGISLNFMEVVKDFYKEENRKSLQCRALQQPFKYYHVPAGYEADYKL